MHNRLLAVTCQTLSDPLPVTIRYPLNVSGLYETYLDMYQLPTRVGFTGEQLLTQIEDFEGISLKSSSNELRPSGMCCTAPVEQ